MPTMKAVVMHAPGGPDVLKIETLPVPTPKAGEVLIRVRAFGLNRSELLTRRGLSPSVKFPRVLGIEAAGEVAEAPGGEFQPGEIVATVMGGMGRDFNGGYAEYTCVPARQVRATAVKLPWETLGAVPEMLQTAWGSLFKSLQLKEEEHLLIRGGTTSVGLAAAAIATNFGAKVASTTRNPNSEALLTKSGAAKVFIDSGTLADDVRQSLPEGAHKVLELVGITTLEDSLRCVRPGGLVCLTGMVGNTWSMDQFSPMETIPTAVGLTVYAGTAADFLAMPFDDLLQQIAAGTLPIAIGKVFGMDDIVEAHRIMEDNKAGGKVVVLT